jgi:hypothetical protein
LIINNYISILSHITTNDNNSYIFINDIHTAIPNNILDQWAGHGRDSILFALNGNEEVASMDYSVVAVEIPLKIAKEKRLLINMSGL